MAIALSHGTPADGTFSASGAAAWNAAHSWSGLTAGRIPYPSSATALTDSANLTYSEASGPVLQVGSSVNGTSTGFIAGYIGASNTWGIWGAGTTGSTSEYTLQGRGDNSICYLRGINDLRLVTNILKFQLTGDAGRGPIITAGTATTDVQALSATQTWNASGVAFTGWKFTITDTASAAGALAMQIFGGAAGTTSLFKVTKGGQVDAPSYAVGGTAGLVSFNGAVTNLTVVNGIVTAAS